MIGAEGDLATAEAVASPRPILTAKLALLCEYASVSEGDKLNLLGIFTNLRVPTLPYVMMQMFVVVVYEVGPEGVPDPPPPLRISVRDPLGQPLVDIEQPVSRGAPRPPSPSGRVSVNQVIGFGGLQFSVAGEYQFEMSWGEGEGRTILPLSVGLMEEEQK